MSERFDYFVIYAGMRTGSNLLEERVNDFGSVHCFGEVFNPAFVGHANQQELFGMSPADVAARPKSMIGRLVENTEGLAGFRLFHDHSPRVLEMTLDNPRCAKILLHRNPLDSYVSLKIARKTNQWRLNDVKKRKQAKADFDLVEYGGFVDQTRAFNRFVSRRTQQSGQTLFRISYDELHDHDLLQGLGRFLGIDVPVVSKSPKTKRQNPQPISEKVSNFEQMQKELGTLEPFTTADELGMEPTRGPMVPNFCAISEPALLFMPMLSGPDQTVRDWMLSVSGAPELATGMTQKLLRKWKRGHAGHRSFTVVRHPMFRAFNIFSEVIARGITEETKGLRHVLSTQYHCDLADAESCEQLSNDELAIAFTNFMNFLGESLAGRAPMAAETSWASQSILLQGMCQFAAPDMIIREEKFDDDIACLTTGFELSDVPKVALDPLYDRLRSVQTRDMQDAAKTAYQRDYMQFGFGKEF